MAESKVCPVTLLQNTSRILRFYFMWPPNYDTDENTRRAIWRNAALLNVYRTLFFIQCCVSIYCGFKAELPQAIVLAVQVVSYVAFWIVCNIATYIQKGLIKLLMELSDFSAFDKIPRNFLTRHKQVEKASQIYIAFILMMLSTNSICMLIVKQDCEANSDFGDYHVVCGTLALTVMPFKIKYDFIKGVVHLYQMIICGNTFVGGCAWFFMQFEINEYVIARMEHLMMLIEEALGTDDEKETRNRFNACLKYHIQIISWSKRLDESFKYVMMMHVTTTATIMGSLANVIIDYHRPGDIAHVVGWVVTLYLACLAGQRSVDMCESINLAIYNSKWYEASIDIQKDVTFMLAMSQRPLHLNAGPFGVLSNALFSKIMKTSYSYLTVMRR